MIGVQIQSRGPGRRCTGAGPEDWQAGQRLPRLGIEEFQRPIHHGREDFEIISLKPARRLQDVSQRPAGGEGGQFFEYQGVSARGFGQLPGQFLLLQTPHVLLFAQRSQVTARGIHSKPFVQGQRARNRQFLENRRGRAQSGQGRAGGSKPVQEGSQARQVGGGQVFQVVQQKERGILAGVGKEHFLGFLSGLQGQFQAERHVTQQQVGQRRATPVAEGCAACEAPGIAVGGFEGQRRFAHAAHPADDQGAGSLC